MQSVLNDNWLCSLLLRCIHQQLKLRWTGTCGRKKRLQRPLLELLHKWRWCDVRFGHFSRRFGCHDYGAVTSHSRIEIGSHSVRSPEARQCHQTRLSCSMDGNRVAPASTATIRRQCQQIQHDPLTDRKHVTSFAAEVICLIAAADRNARVPATRYGS